MLTRADVFLMVRLAFADPGARHVVVSVRERENARGGGYQVRVRGRVDGREITLRGGVSRNAVLAGADQRYLVDFARHLRWTWGEETGQRLEDE